MGKLVDGVWQDVGYNTKDTKGKFVRADSSFRDWVKSSADAKHKAESGRYHLYVSLACPWAHRALIFRELKGLSEHIGITVVSPDMGAQGWLLDSDSGPVAGCTKLYEVYTHALKTYTGRVTVPVLWDKVANTIVSNESSEIIRMFNSEFNAITGNKEDYYPVALRSSIDEWNEHVYTNINNGVYKCGFATTQEAYEGACNSLFAALDKVDAHLSTNRYLAGSALTEADWRLFTTLVRFDCVYVGHFKCNKRRIYDYKHIQGYLKELYQIKGIKSTVDFNHIKRHYYFSHTSVNPTQVVPLGPELDLDSPHGREHL